MRKISKWVFLPFLEECCTSLLSSPEDTAEVIDGAATVQSLKPVVSNTFREYAMN